MTRIGFYQFSPRFGERDANREKVLAALEQHEVNVVAIKQSEGFSGKVPAELRAALVERYPNQVGCGRFSVRWRD